MDMEKLKWHMPGWRIEQKFAPGVLIGNWDEDRYRFQKLNLPHNSTQRIDFKHVGSHRPDVLVRRKCQLRNEGLTKEHLFDHHGKTYSNNMISWYDEHYNNRERDNKLPELRTFNSHKMGWVPEKTDHPLQAYKDLHIECSIFGGGFRKPGAPTNFGLRSKLQERAEQQMADESRGDYCSTYSAAYERFGRDAMVKTRYATPHPHSTSVHKFNLVNKNLNLRNGSMIQSPERLPNAETDVNLGGSSAPIPAATVPMPV